MRPVPRQNLRPGRGRSWRPDWRGIEREQQRRGWAARERTPAGQDWHEALRLIRAKLERGRP
jgi:hypothetical protein